MSWLVRMQLNRQMLAHCCFQDSYAWHQAVWECFPGIPDGKRDFLSRMDWLNQGCRLYLLSRKEAVRPDWCPLEAWSIKQIAPTFLQHKFYAFDLLANPTRKIASFTADGQRTRNGRRLALLDKESRQSWMETKASQHGFYLDGPLVMDEVGTSIFWRHARTGTHIGVRFRGCLQVTDQERFIHAFYHGIGSAKAFGFGMLLLHPLY